MKKYIAFLFFITITTSLSAQIERMKRKHVKVYETTDSLIAALYAQGVDTLVALHRVWSWEKMKNYDGNEEVYSSFLLWADEGMYYYQRVSEYAIYKPVRQYRKDGLLLYLLRYYFINQEEIDANPIPFTLLMQSDEGKSLKQLVYEGGDFSILSYQFGALKNQMYWYTPNLRLDDRSGEFDIFNMKSFIWSQMIERELRKAIDVYWRPINEKVESMTSVSDFLSGMENEMKKFKAESEFFEETHQYKRQEILIPEGFSGLVSIVQEQPCGKKLRIRNEVRTIAIPEDGNLILDKRYVVYSQEFRSADERKKTSAFIVKGNKRKPLALLDDASKPDDFGLSVFGQFYSIVNSKEYRITVMHVGLQKDGQAMFDQKKYFNDQLPARLAKCDGTTR